MLSAVRTPSRDLVSVSGNARSAVRLLLVVLSPLLPPLPSLSDLLFKDFVVLRLKLKPLLESWNSHSLFVQKTPFIGILLEQVPPPMVPLVADTVVLLL